MNSDFNKSIRVNNLSEEFDVFEESEDNFIEVMCETDRPDIRDFMMDISRRYSEYDVDKIVLLRAIYIELETYERVLWDLYFNQMLSMRDIGKKLDLPLSSVYNMVKELKIKVKLRCGI
jgi:DNA-directed RNA polymerase specialized sigma subunit